MSETAHGKQEPPDKCPQVEVVRESDKEQHAQAMGDAELCEFITKALSPAKKILRDSLAYIAEARKRFAQPGRRVPVPGRPTWGKWIKQNLGISDRHVRRLLAGEGEPQKRHNKKPEPRVEVESAGIILGNKGLEMARKLRDGDVDGAKRIAAEMLEVNLDCPDGLLPPPVPEHMKTLGKGDIETLASLWRQAFNPLTQAQRRDMLVRFFGLIPGEHIADVTAAIERAPIHMGCAGAAGKAERRSGGGSRKPPASVKTTEGPPVRGPEEDCGHGALDAASVKGSAPVAEGRGSTPPKKTSQEHRRRKTLTQRKWREKKQQARLAAQAASPAPPQEAGSQGMASQGGPQPAAAPTPKHGRGEKARKHTASPKVTICLPVLSPEEEERKHGTLDSATGHPGRRQGDFVLNEEGIWECEPELGMGEADQNRNAQPGKQQLPPSKPTAADPKPFRVKKRTKGDIIDFAIFRDGDKLPDEVFDSKDEAVSHCESLNKSLVANIVPQHINPQSAAQSAAY
jgi:hypothetical protein